ncbi:MAG: transposase [Kiritimatiellia bacterium]
MKQQKPIFKAFNPYESIMVYRRNLPHWRQDGACYFVTWRLNDSIPKKVIDVWQEEREIWLKEHGVNVNLRGDEWRVAYESIDIEERREFERERHFKFNECLDAAHGSCVLRNQEFAKIVLQSLFYFDGERCWAGDTVIMANHVHALIIPVGELELKDLLHSVKRFSARKINAVLKREGPLWQRDSYDHIVRSTEELRVYRKYIAKNAEQAGLALDGDAYRRADWLDEYAKLED